MRIFNIYMFLLCLLLSGCGGCCQDKPVPLVRYDRVPNNDTMTLGDTVSVIDRSYCKEIKYFVSTSPLDSYKSLVYFNPNSNFGSYDYVKGYSNLLNRYYADSASNTQVFDTSSRLQFRFIMNGDTGKHIIVARGTSTFMACENGWPVAADVPVEVTIYDTIYVKRK